MLKLEHAIPARKLVLRLAEVSGETLPSYIDRLTDRYGTSLAVMLDRLGVKRGRGAAYGCVLSDSEQQGIAAATGLTKDAIAGMLYERSWRYVDPRLFEASSAARQTVKKENGRHAVKWGSMTGSHFCPMCLRESGGVWLKRWRLPWSFTCVRHKILLCDVCPACGKRPRTEGLRWFPCVRFRSTPMFCNNSRLSHSMSNPNICGYSFADAAGYPAPPSTIASQKFLNEILDEKERDKNNQFVDAFLNELEGVCSLIIYAFELTDFANLTEQMEAALRECFEHRESVDKERLDIKNKHMARRCRPFADCPERCALMAAVVQEALAIVQPEHEETAKERIQVLANRVRERAGSRKLWSVIERTALSVKLRIALEECLAPYTLFDRRNGIYSIKAVVNDPLLFRAKNVPQVAPKDYYEAHFIRFFNGADQLIARQFCSVAVVKLLGFTWEESVRELELGEITTQRVGYMRVVLRRNGALREFEEALRRWARSLSREPVKIDYQVRREALRTVRGFSQSSWTTLCKKAGVRRGIPGKRSRCCAAWMWADATGGDWSQSPAFSVGPRYRRSDYEKKLMAIMPAMAPVLRGEAKRRIDRYQASLDARTVSGTRRKGGVQKMKSSSSAASSTTFSAASAMRRPASLSG